MAGQQKRNMSELADRKCIPCEGGVPAMTPEEAQNMLLQLHDWMLIDNAHLLAKSFQFKNFKEVMSFANKVAAIAEEQQHHPDMSLSYNTMSIELTTHAVGGLSKNDFIVAAKIDALKK